MNLYNKYRPKLFEDVVQSSAVKLLQAQISNNSEVSAYLLGGPSGTGKTTLVRIMAMALMCSNRKDGDSEPCGTCLSCKQIINDSNRDVIEINCATEGKVDDIRNLLAEKIRIQPMNGSYRIFILDECLDYDSSVEMADGTICKIGKIVSSKMDAKVISYNFNTEQYEPKQIVGWHKNSPKPVYYWRFKSTDSKKHFSLKAADNHVVFNENNEEVRLQDLCIGEKINVTRRIRCKTRKKAYDYKLGIHYSCGNGMLNIPAVKMTKEDHSGSNLYIKQEAVFVEKIETKRHGAWTYDITVEDNHNYIANSVMVHNCHMLTKSSQNALLKMVEEPPSYVKFFLCTTAMSSVIETIRNRCQCYKLTKVSKINLNKVLQNIVEKEHITIDAKGIELIIESANGSPRAAISLLETVAPIGANEENVREALAKAPKQISINLLKAIQNQDRADAYQIIMAADAEGRDLCALIEECCRILVNEVVYCKIFNKKPEDPDIAILVEGFNGPQIVESTVRLLKINTEVRQNVPADLLIPISILSVIDRYAILKEKIKKAP